MSKMERRSATAAECAVSIAAAERHTIVKVLKETNGDKVAAARILGIGKTTIYRKLKEYAAVSGAHRS